MIRSEQQIMFNRDDVIKVAKALLENHWYFDSGDYSRDQYCCYHCSGVTKEWSKPDEVDKIPHEQDCPVLAARDLLTGFDE